jgi:hypothetical protein
MKWMWRDAPTKGERDYWAEEAEKIRELLSKAGYSDSEIMQSNDALITEEEVMKRAREEHPILAFIADFTEDAFEYPGEAAVTVTSAVVLARLGKNYNEGLEFTVKTAQRMEQVGRYVPIKTLYNKEN